jgi:hypothetical protein
MGLKVLGPPREAMTSFLLAAAQERDDGQTEGELADHGG